MTPTARAPIFTEQEPAGFDELNAAWENFTGSFFPTHVTDVLHGIVN